MPHPIKLNHVGLAVPSIEQFLRRFDVIYGRFQRSAPIRNERQQVLEQFVSDGSSTIELLQPLETGKASPLDGFLAKNRRGGLIHLAFDVVDLDASLAAIKAVGGRVVLEPVPDVAFQERRIAFVWIDGHIAELIERK